MKELYIHLSSTLTKQQFKIIEYLINLDAECKLTNRELADAVGFKSKHARKWVSCLVRQLGHKGYLKITPPDEQKRIITVDWDFIKNNVWKINPDDGRTVEFAKEV